jgi:signal peptidase II
MRGRAIARVALIVAAVVGADQVAKALVRSGVSVGEEDNVFPGVQIVHVKNTGVAFGALSGGGAIVLVLTGAALVLLVSYFARNPARPLLWLPTGLLLGGAAGNLVDRIRLGSVTDFIKLPLWPAFNVADMAITFGVLALLYVLEGPRRPATP